MNKRTIIVFFFVLISLLGSIGVAGLLQYSEKIGSSGIIIKPPPPPTPAPSPSPEPPPPEPTIKIETFSNQECTQPLMKILWGEIGPGGKSRNKIYIKNTGDSDVFLSLLTGNWNPTHLDEYLTITWDYDSTPIKPSEVVGVTIELRVSASIVGITEFSFDVIFCCTPD